MELVAAAASRRLTRAEVSLVLIEGANGVESFRARFRHRVSNGLEMGAEDFVPQSASYWQRLCGPLSDELDPESYIRERLIPYRRELLDRDLAGGLEMCCLGALRDDLMPAEWIAAVDDDTVWQALYSMNLTGNPIALLAALDVALLRSEDGRFREFAADAVRTLLDDNLGLPEAREVYRAHRIVCDFVMNAVSFSEQASAQPGYWRRMGAWMQTGLIVQTLVDAPTPIDVDGLEAWCQSEAAFGGDVRRLADSRTEPMVLASQIGAGSLRYEIAIRLLKLMARHGAAGRDFPLAEEVATTLGRLSGKGASAMVPIPGPMDLHLLPSEAMPEDLRAALEAHSDIAVDSRAMEVLAAASQLFLLDGDDVERAKNSVAKLGDGNDAPLEAQLTQLYSASIAAAAARDAELAARIGSIVKTLAGLVSQPVEVGWAIRVLLQAAAAYEDEADWARWLEEQFADLATWLPQPRLSDLWSHSEGIERVLPATHWCHLRAKAIAAADRKRRLRPDSTRGSKNSPGRLTASAPNLRAWSKRIAHSPGCVVGCPAFLPGFQRNP